MNDTSPKIRVMQPCPVPGCKAPWFTCNLKHGAEIVTVYECEGVDGLVTKAEIAYVRERHPGMDLVYV
jgi:hypothetical protein